MTKKVSAIGMLVGMIFGAGIFALPYSISRAGLFWGLIHFIAAFFVILGLHLLYANIVFHLPGKHRFVGYVEISLGKKAKTLAFLNTLFSYYGALLVYAILGGFFLSNIFPFLHSFYWSFIFLLFGSFFLFFGLKDTGKINFYLTLPLLFCVVILSFLLFLRIDGSTFFGLNKILSSDWFFPYGVFIFSFGGFAVIPDAADFFKNNQVDKQKFFQSLREFKNTIKISQIIIAAFYLIFIVSVLGVLGASATENTFYDISDIIGATGLYIASSIGFLAVLTSFIALTYDFKNIFLLDYGLPLKISWFLIVLPIITLLFFVNQKFTAVISAVGAIGLGIFGVFILLMAEKSKKQFRFSGFLWSSFVLKFLVFLLVLGALYGFIDLF